MQKQLNELLSREMTRQEFLATIGLGLATAFGFSGILRMLNGKSLSGGQQAHSYGYGRSTYGGHSEG